MTREVTVIGLGLIGGSIARRLTAAGDRVSGVDPDSATRAAAERDGIRALARPEELPEQPELVIVAVPPEQTRGVLLAALERWPDALISDVASVKGPVIPEVPERSGSGGYLPGHPLAGSESTGYRASSPDTFDGAVWALCPTPRTPLELLPRFGPVLDDLGAVALICTPETHDRAVARTSHLPHVVAISLAAANLVEPAAMIATLSGGALRDSSRIAAADIELWWEILRANRGEVLSAIEDFQDTFAALKGAIAADDQESAATIWKRGQEAHALIVRSRWSARSYSEVAHPLSGGWAPWLQMGERGTVLRNLRLDSEELRAQAS